MTLLMKAMSLLRLLRNSADIVAEVGAVERREAAAYAGLHGIGDDLLQVRVANEEIGQAARVRRARAGQFGRRRRPVGHGIAGIGGQPGAT